MNCKLQYIFRYLFIVLVGVILYYAFDLSGGNPIVGLFAPINNSVWESLKLIYYPFLLLTIFDLFTGPNRNPWLLPARVAGILGAIVFFIVAFYTVTSVIGVVIFAIAVIIYLFGIALAFYLERKIRCKQRCANNAYAIAVLIILAFLFVIFTIAPPAFGIFLPLPIIG